MRHSNFLRAGSLLALILLTLTSVSAAASDRYRAEFIILERLSHPGFHESMASRTPDVVDSSLRRMLVLGEDGSRSSDLSLVSPANTSLADVARRLESSGDYRILGQAAWVQRFPPNYQGEPLRIELGDMIPGTGHRAVEGTIQIDRQRFLHVNTKLNHWRPAQASAAPASSDDEATGDAASEPVAVGKELVTWIRENRRMRSQEIHFLDSPTIGILVFFRRLD